MTSADCGVVFAAALWPLTNCMLTLAIGTRDNAMTAFSTIDAQGNLPRITGNSGEELVTTDSIVRPKSIRFAKLHPNKSCFFGVFTSNSLYLGKTRHQVISVTMASVITRLTCTVGCQAAGPCGTCDSQCDAWLFMLQVCRRTVRLHLWASTQKHRVRRVRRPNTQHAKRLLNRGRHNA